MAEELAEAGRHGWAAVQATTAVHAHVSIAGHHGAQADARIGAGRRRGCCGGHLVEQRLKAAQRERGCGGGGCDGAGRRAGGQIEVALAQTRLHLHESAGVVTGGDVDGVEDAVVASARSGGQRTRGEVEVRGNARIRQRARQAGLQLSLRGGQRRRGWRAGANGHHRVGGLAGGERDHRGGQRRDVGGASGLRHGVDAAVVRAGVAASLDAPRPGAGQRARVIRAVVVDRNVVCHDGARGVEHAQLALRHRRTDGGRAGQVRRSRNHGRRR